MSVDNRKSQQTEIRVSVDSIFLDKLQKKLKLKKGTDVTRVALTILDWASSEVERDRTILSATNDGKDLHRLVMPELANIEKKS
jgi:hypothetical protein